MHKRIGYWLGMLAVVSVAGMIGRLVGTFAGLATINDELARQAREMNSELPTMIDETTRADFVRSGPGNTLTFYYTSMDDQMSRKLLANLDTFKANVLRNSCRLNGDYQRGTMRKYEYRDLNGNLLIEIVETPDICRNLRS